ncbi:hypothetical protein D3C87_1337660 [compost metagenome]
MRYGVHGRYDRQQIGELRSKLARVRCHPDPAHQIGEQKKFERSQIPEGPERIRHSGLGRAEDRIVVARLNRHRQHEGLLDLYAHELRRHKVEHQPVPVELAVVELQGICSIVDPHDRIAHLVTAIPEHFLKIADEIYPLDVIPDGRVVGLGDGAVVAHAVHRQCTEEKRNDHEDARDRPSLVKPPCQREHHDEFHRFGALSGYHDTIQVKNEIERKDGQR